MSNTDKEVRFKKRILDLAGYWLEYEGKLYKFNTILSGTVYYRTKNGFFAPKGHNMHCSDLTIIKIKSKTLIGKLRNATTTKVKHGCSGITTYGENLGCVSTKKFMKIINGYTKKWTDKDIKENIE